MNTEKMMATQVALADLQVIPEVFSYDKDISYSSYLEMIYHNGSYVELLTELHQLQESYLG